MNPTFSSTDPVQSPSPTGPRRTLARFGAALAVAVVLATGVVGYVGGQALTDPAKPTIAAADSVSDSSAIQDTITRANTEQAQALAAANPSLMADTATPQYLRELTQINQDMATSGVSSIALVNVEWGPITATGSTATATTYETWTTTLSDGTTLQSRDENDYSLTLDNGTWRIGSDAHPAATATDQPSTGATAPTTANTGDLASSSNWAGYAATNGTYTAVSGTWTVPAYAAASSSGVSATWVGIGGVSSHDLIQAGTQQQTNGTGQTAYQAWIEMLPQASRNVPLTITPGDSVSVSISEQGSNSWLISFKNDTTNQSYQQTVPYTSSRSSAEWIEEAPSAARAGVLPLDNFGTVSFDQATTVKNGQSVSMSEAGATGITMIGANRQPLAAPSVVGSDGDSFSVSRTNVAATTQPSLAARTRRGIGGA